MAQPFLSAFKGEKHCGKMARTSTFAARKSNLRELQPFCPLCPMVSGDLKTQIQQFSETVESLAVHA
jgi:hypothetical protein